MQMMDVMSRSFCVDVRPLPLDGTAAGGAVEVGIDAVGLVGRKIVPFGDLGADGGDDGT